MRIRCLRNRLFIFYNFDVNDATLLVKAGPIVVSDSPKNTPTIKANPLASSFAITLVEKVSPISIFKNPVINIK